MKRAATIAATALATTLAGATLAPAGFAQAAPALSYVQPLSTQAVEAVQDRLRQAGVYAGTVDGIWGPDSAAALQHFQQSHQLQVTGQMNQATAATLGMDPASLAAVAAATPPPEAPAPVGTLTAASVRAVQSRLQALNFYTGAVDGVWGESTQAAIERFQQGRGLQPNGQLNPATVTAMGLTPGALSYR